MMFPFGKRSRGRRMRLFPAKWLAGGRRRRRWLTLQWHLTNACEFHCRHCYDRSDRGAPSLEEAIRAFDGFRALASQLRRRLHVSLSGGDPLCYPHFQSLYEAIGLTKTPVSILGNPLSAERLTQLMETRPPWVYQVSLEGLAERNDAVRGAGHFDRVMRFLVDARRCGLTTHVMLTLTRENLEDVLPLAERLRGLTHRFRFNRLAGVGNAAGLATPTREEFADFLERYLIARRTNPILDVKENLFNILRHRAGRGLFPGCTGTGCGAASDFLALLPDGEVHACRKYPSRIGSVGEASPAELWHSEAAERYRAGSAACRGCPVRARCGGCPAVTYGCGLDPLVDRDPHCFFDA